MCSLIIRVINYAVNNFVSVLEPLNSAFQMQGYVTSASPTQFTLATRHSNVASETEPYAIAEQVGFLNLSTTLEGQATGTLTCITSNFQAQINTTLNGTVNNHTGSQYTPGNYNSTTYHAAFDIPCDDDLNTCDGSIGGGGTDCSSDTGCGGGGVFVQFPQTDIGLEVAHTKEFLPTPNAPLYSYDESFFGITVTYGTFTQNTNCENTPDFVPPPVSFPFMYKWEGVKIPLKPPADFWLFALCENVNHGPWSCVEIAPIYIISNSALAAHCTALPR